MFGSVPIFGNGEYTLDSKNRLFIPSFTYAEENDQLIIQKGNDNFYIIANASAYEKKIKTLKETNAEDKISILTSSIVALVKVDKQKRIMTNFGENFAIDRKVFIHGNYDNIQVFSSKSHYEAYIDKLKKSR